MKRNTGIGLNYIIKNPQYKGIFDGFSGKRLVNLGIDFGWFECRISEELLDFYLQNLKFQISLYKERTLKFSVLFLSNLNIFYYFFIPNCF